MKTAYLVAPCCHKCTHSPGEPCRNLIRCLNHGPICHDNNSCTELRKNRMMKARYYQDRTTVLVGAGTCGMANGAGKIIRYLENIIQNENHEADVVETGCNGYCQNEIFVDFIFPDRSRYSYCNISPENIGDLASEIFEKNNRHNRFLFGVHSDSPNNREETVAQKAFFRHQIKVVLANCGIINPYSLDSALASGAFEGLSKALQTLTPEEICQEILHSGLRGRGGGGFPTGQKWQIALQANSKEKFIICNADEGDPGAFMDRAILEGDPYRIIEGMIIGGYATGASNGYVYCRAEYPLAIKRMQSAIEQCRNAGLLGENIMGSLYNFQIKIKQGAGAFVCGEETAIIASIEGGRGMPRPRPPYPAEKGLYDKPTVLNNVETLASIPPIINNGPEWYRDLGLNEAAGTKVFALSGSVKNTGLIEVPVGTPLSRIVMDIGGGALAGHHVKAVQIGGPSGGCIPAQHLDVPVDYSNLKELGAMMGSGGMVVMDETTCMVDVAKFFMEFIKNESCGKCTPCREGTTRMHEILSAISEKPPADNQIKRLERMKGVFHLWNLAETISETSLCGLGQSSANPVLSTLRFFKDEYEAHIMENMCPTDSCEGLRTYRIDSALCIGCTICRRECPVSAIVGDKKRPHYILEDRCTGCGACADICPRKAIYSVRQREVPQ